MALGRKLGGTALALTLTVAAFQAHGQSAPAEFPPSDFQGNQYVDSNGCAFVRAGIGGTLTWVPRMNRQRQTLCNFQPTFPDGTAVAGQAFDPDLIIDLSPPAEADTAAAPAPALAPSATIAQVPTPAPARSANVSLPPLPSLSALPAPIETVSSVTGGTIEVPASPRVVTETAPVRPTVTLAEACAGRFGVQPGFVSSATGAPIDCGPAPQADLPAAVHTGPSPDIPRMTLAQVCAEAADTGIRFINAETGAPVACPQAPAPVVVATAPVRPAASPDVVAPANRSIGSAAPCGGAIPLARSDGRYTVRCGAAASVTRSRVSTSSAPVLNPGAAIPASNPGAVSVTPPAPPSGYDRIWTDGRINPQRGLVVAQPQAVTARVSTRTAPQAAVPAAPMHRFIQVGSFGDHANADRLIQRLGAAGLPVASGRSGALKIVAAGPFADAAQLGRALQTVRGLGFADAYTRN